MNDLSPHTEAGKAIAAALADEDLPDVIHINSGQCVDMSDEGRREFRDFAAKDFMQVLVGRPELTSLGMIDNGADGIATAAVRLADALAARLWPEGGGK